MLKVNYFFNLSVNGVIHACFSQLGIFLGGDTLAGASHAR